MNQYAGSNHDEGDTCNAEELADVDLHAALVNQDAECDCCAQTEDQSQEGSGVVINGLEVCIKK